MLNRIARLTVIAVAALGVALPVARGGAQESKSTVVVMAFNNEAGPGDAREYDGLNKAIADFLITDLSANPNIHVVDRSRAQRATDEQRLGASAAVGRESAARVGRALGAQKVIFGGFTPDARGNFRIDARAVDVASGAVELSDRVQDRADNIVLLVRQLAGRLTGAWGLPAPARGSDAGAGIPMRDAVTYGRALDMTDRGERARARELYEAVLKEYPDYEPAKRGLAKLKPGA